jgi:hypothetical protein
MKKHISLILCFIISCGFFIVPTSAAPYNTNVSVKQSNTAPVIDGIINEGEYGEKIHSVDYSKDEFISYYDQDKSIRADFYMTWHQDSLYMAWVVYTDKHTPIDPSVDYNKDGKADAEFGGQDLAFMYKFSCVQFMLCTGAPDKNKSKYQVSEWSGNYLEAGLTYLNNGKSVKFIWSRPAGGEGFTSDSLGFCGSWDKNKKTTVYETKIPLSKLGVRNVGDGTQIGLSYTIGDQEDFERAPNMCEWQDAILNGKNMDAGAVITLSEKTTDGLIMGAPVANPDYNMTVTAPFSYKPGDTVKVNITLNDIKAESGYHLMKFQLYYDSSKVEPVLKNDAPKNNNMQSFITKAPGIENWEGFSKLEEEYSRYEIAFLNGQTKGGAKSNGDLVVSVPFKIKNDATGKIIFQVPHKSTMCVDNDLVKHYGNAGMAAMYDNQSEIGVLQLKEDSKLTIDSTSNLLLGMKEKTTVSDLVSQFEGTVMVLDRYGNTMTGNKYVGTGCTVTNGRYSIVVLQLGDADGDGIVDSLDYYIAKKIILGNGEFSDLEIKAVCVSGAKVPDSTDYYLIKKHCLGNYDLYN